MTKKLLLSAAAVAAMAFAGAAGAADITTATISGYTLPIADGAISAPYAVATEAVLDTTAGIVSTKASSHLTIGMDSPVTVSAGTNLPFAVTFTLTGPATFNSTPAYTDLGVPVDGVLANDVPASAGVVVMSSDKKSVSFFVEIGRSTSLNVESLRLKNLDLKVVDEAAVSLAAETKVTVAGFTQTISVVDETKIGRAHV